MIVDRETKTLELSTVYVSGVGIYLHGHPCWRYLAGTSSCICPWCQGRVRKCPGTKAFNYFSVAAQMQCSSLVNPPGSRRGGITINR